MRLIHSNPECRSIAIWFDEFLTPGESFKESIETMLNDCNLFTLLVTPRLLEKVIDERGKEQDNYVLAVELPMARKNREEKGTDIFAVEMEHTEKAALSAIQIEDYVNCRDAAFRSRLLESVTRIAAEPSDAPAHNYLIGLAYRDGIDVEVNRQQALELITSAAKANLPEAMLELSYMYQKGIGVTVNCSKALEWMQQLMEYEKTKHGSTRISAKGSYKHENRTMLYSVISENELSIAMDSIMTIDPNAFVHVTHSMAIKGKFYQEPLD